MNYGRYAYLLGGTKKDPHGRKGKSKWPNAFHHGCCRNCVNFCDLACCPSYVKTDWATTYLRPIRTPALPQTTGDDNNVKMKNEEDIPMEDYEIFNISYDESGNDEEAVAPQLKNNNNNQPTHHI